MNIDEVLQTKQVHRNILNTEHWSLQHWHVFQRRREC